MFENLSDRLEGVFKTLRGHGKLSEDNIEEAMAEVRKALLEADVNFSVAKKFIQTVTEKSLGQEVAKSLSPGQQVIKIVHNELVQLLGGVTEQIELDGRQPVTIMLAGLQGSGKTTTTAKLAKMLKARGRRPYLVPADVYRPAAIEQLQVLGNRIEVPVHPSQTDSKPVDICQQALLEAEKQNCDTILIDTAGRLHVDDLLMAELRDIQSAVTLSEILFVADAMTGQDAVSVADRFNKDLEVSGIVLTKMDGDARGGAALSIKNITGKPIKFVGLGEGLDDLEVFHPERVASRILGMGDILSLIEKAEAVVDKKEADRLVKKLKKNQFTLEDFLEQIQQIRKMGSLDQILDMVPGINKLKKLKDVPKPDEKELVKTEAIIRSMTPKERNNHSLINQSRRRRIAAGSGTQISEVNRVIKSYSEMLKMMKKMRGRPGAIAGVKRRKLPKGMKKR
ncbi:MAG: signal recognition particle protein [Deltaproteobacteria bacterium]|nr:MAG: signal recognition particle protein [Deltaproteobacteria bacterium]PIE73456.1 MAG: signal recognition particle protein [Deltaproteobacteria bacterium]